MAVLLMVLATAMIPLGDVGGTLLIREHGFAPVFVAWARMSMGLLAAIPLCLALGAGRRALHDWRAWLRGGFFAATIVSILSALRTIDIATAFGAFFLGPPLSYVLSAIFLGERMTAARSLLLVLGFCGVLLVTRPGFGMTPGLAFALLAGVMYSAFLTTGRWLSGEVGAPGLLLVQMLVGTTVLAPWGVPVAIAPADPAPGWPWALLLLSGGASFIGNLALIVAYGRAQATVMAPLVYLILIAATVYGVLVFDTLPDAAAAAGLVLLLASGFGSLALRRAA